MSEKSIDLSENKSKVLTENTNLLNNYSRSEVISLIFLNTSIFLCGLAFSILAPFFPSKVRTRIV